MKEVLKENFKEAEIEKKSKPRRISTEIIFFLILGFLLGIAIKTEAVKRITIGHDDYRIDSLKQGYDFVQIQKDLSEQSAQANGANSDGESNQEQGAQDAQGN
jgi:hypothetical protein